MAANGPAATSCTRFPYLPEHTDMAASRRQTGWQRARQRLRQRVRDWALRRQGPDALPLVLRTRRLYILPTRAGLTLGALAGIAFIAGMNYGSGLAMLLCFWLTAFLLTAMVQTHGRLAGVKVLSATARPVFATEPVLLALGLQGNVPGATLQLQAVGAAPASGTTTLSLRFGTQRRGLWQAPALELSTQAPFGLFRCWTWLSPPLATEVYPHPEGNRPMPLQETGTGGPVHAGGPGHDELAGLRPFRDGDSPRQVAWKAYARGLPLLAREYHGSGRTARELRFDALPGLDTEQRLSQLARWVLQAGASPEAFTLLLPGEAPLTGSGPAHRQRCLAALARF